MFAAFLTTILFSISAVCGSRTARLLGGTEANFFRLLFATLLLGLWSHLFGIGLAGEALAYFFISGCVGFGVGDLAFFQALPRIGSRLSVLLVQCLAAPFAALIEWLWLGTTLTPVQLLSGLTILGGVGIALSPGQHLNSAPREVVTGTLYGILAAVCQGLGAVLSRKAYNVAAAAGETITGVNAAYQRIVGGVLISGALLAYLRWAKSRGQAAGTGAAATKGTAAHWRQAWPWLLINGLAGPTLGVSCYQWALRTTPTGVVLPIVAITPLVVIPFAWAVEGEKVSLRSIIGGIIAVAGVLGLTLAR